MIHFENPFWAIFLLGVPLLLAAYFLLFRFRIDTLAELGLSNEMMRPRAKDLEILRALFLGGALCFSLFALMNPVGNGRYIQGAEGGGNVLFLLDASASMEIADTSSGVTRFDLARETIGDISEALSGYQVSLASFTSEVTPLVPPTFDRFFLQLLLRETRINEGGVPGTDFLSWLNWLKEKKSAAIVLTDGGDTHLAENREKILAAAKELEHPLVIIGIGGETPRPIPGFKEESKLEGTFLKELAEASKGAYFTEDQVKSAIQFLSSPKKREKGETLVHDEYFYLPLIGAILLLGGAILLPETRRSA